MSEGHQEEGLLQLWREGQLCDVRIRTRDGAEFTVHKVVLAASSLYFRSLFVGAGRHMRESFPSGDSALPVVFLDQVRRMHFPLWEQYDYEAVPDGGSNLGEGREPKEGAMARGEEKFGEKAGYSHLESVLG